MKFTLPTNIKLKSKKHIDALFTQGKSMRKGALRAVYIVSTQEQQVGFSVSKRFFKKSVDRNRIKRLLREAYRLNQHKLTTHCHIMFMYQSPQMPDYKQIEQLICRVLKELESQNQEDKPTA